MNKYADIVKNNLETLITELTENSHLYLKNPEKDFTHAPIFQIPFHPITLPVSHSSTQSPLHLRSHGL